MTYVTCLRHPTREFHKRALEFRWDYDGAHDDDHLLRAHPSFRAGRAAGGASAAPAARARHLQAADRDQHDRQRRRHDRAPRSDGRAAARSRAFRRRTSSSAVRRRAKATWSSRYRGRPATTRKPLLLLAHLDVVEAKKEDWSPDLDPFRFIEKDGFFYGRGTADDKAMAAIFVANLLRMKQQGLVPDRDIVLALTADEEGGDHNGVQWLLANHRALVDAEFGLNEGGGGQAKGGRRIANRVQASEKVYVDLHARGHEQRRTQLAAAGGERDLRAGRRARAHRQVHVSRRAERSHARVLRRSMAAVEPGQLAADFKAIVAVHAGRRRRSRGSRRCRSTTRCSARRASRRW